MTIGPGPSNAAQTTKRAGRNPARPQGQSMKRGYGVVLVPGYEALPGVQPGSPSGQTGVPPTGPMAGPPDTLAELTAIAPEQPLPSHAASKSTLNWPASEPAPDMAMMTQF